MSVLQPTDAEQTNIIKEQLQLFTLDDSPRILPDPSMSIDHEANKRERLACLLAGELDFQGEKTGYASHDLHAFAAKFPPQLPRAFIRGLSEPGDLVLDPMMGSGTTVVEALLEGRQGIGLDIDPLALRLSRVKTNPLDVDCLRHEGHRVLTRANALLANTEVIKREIVKRFDERTMKFIDYWFFTDTQCELMSLALSIEEVDDAATRRFLELTFSAIIVTKSGGVSRARDLAHSRPHLDKTKTPKNALEQFSVKLRKNLISMSQLSTNGINAQTVAGDARSMPFADRSVDLIVTSPPYANALDYMRAHKFSLVWFGKSVAELSEMRATYIGSERIGQAQYGSLPERPEAIIGKLAELDKSKAAILRKYFLEMADVLAEMYRVLRNDSAAIVVVGTSIMRDIEVETHSCLADIAAVQGFEVVGVARRNLDRNKRMMPARFGRKSDSMIEQRMHEEYVIGLMK